MNGLWSIMKLDDILSMVWWGRRKFVLVCSNLRNKRTIWFGFMCMCRCVVFEEGEKNSRNEQHISNFDDFFQNKIIWIVSFHIIPLKHQLHYQIRENGTNGRQKLDTRYIISSKLSLFPFFVLLIHLYVSNKTQKTKYWMTWRTVRDVLTTVFAHAFSHPEQKNLLGDVIVNRKIHCTIIKNYWFYSQTLCDLTVSAVEGERSIVARFVSTFFCNDDWLEERRGIFSSLAVPSHVRSTVHNITILLFSHFFWRGGRKEKDLDRSKVENSGSCKITNNCVILACFQS